MYVVFWCRCVFVFAETSPWWSWYLSLACIMRVFMYTCTRVCMLCTCAWMHAAHVCICKCMHALNACVCMHVKYIHTHTRIHTQTYIALHIAHTCIHSNIHSFTSCTYMYSIICIYIHTYIHTCIHTYIHAYIHTYMHTYIHAGRAFDFNCVQNRHSCRSVRAVLCWG